LFQNPLSSSTVSGSSKYLRIPRARETSAIIRIAVISTVPVEDSPNVWSELKRPLLTTMAAYNTKIK